ncbi:MAG: DUF4331 family protein [Ginsengibacter sp.]
MKQKKLTRLRLKWIISGVFISIFSAVLMSSSHREAPMIANDPLADNTDLYAFRSPLAPRKLIIIANYIPFQLPQGGPNFYQFGENIRYEIHIDNNAATPGDDVVYRFTFKKENQDPTTFFNLRLGQENLKTTYEVRRSIGGNPFVKILTGTVPPPNIGPRSIESPVGVGAKAYDSLIYQRTNYAITGERVFAGPIEDPFFVDLGGAFDLGDLPRQSGKPIDGLKCINVSSIAIEIPIEIIQKDHKRPDQAKNILDPNFVVGIWASASRQKIRTLNDATSNDPASFETHSGDWVQVSRLGMPLTNEVIIPVGYKDYWNRLTPYQDLSKLSEFGNFFYNPELALYTKGQPFGTAVPAFNALGVQNGFKNGQDGLYGLKGSPKATGTALDDKIFGKLLLPGHNRPRSVDLWPIFHTGVPNLAPYQLATGKNGNPLAAGKPFVNNFLPNGGDMLRINMAVPVTPRDSKDFSSEGLIQAAVLGLTDPRYNTNSNIQFIPNMDGFPNGRRLEDDVTRIELQAVGGVVLAAIGLWYDDYNPKVDASPVTPDLLSVLGYSTGVEKNDVKFRTWFPFVQAPFSGTHVCDCGTDQPKEQRQAIGKFPVTSTLGIAAPEVFATASPNPVINTSRLNYRVQSASLINITVVDVLGKPVKVLANKKQDAGSYTIEWNTSSLAKGSYFISISKNGEVKQTLPLIKAN